jgi:hypothetical protein
MCLKSHQSNINSSRLELSLNIAHTLVLNLLALKLLKSSDFIHFNLENIAGVPSFRYIVFAFE